MIEMHMPQGSPEWWAVRRGIPTGSQFGRIITPKKGEYASGADTYAAELIAESLGWQSGFHGSPDTERGNRLEKEALRWLSFRYGISSRDVGFCLSDCGRYGASPDGIAPDGSPIEVKAPDLHTFLKWRVKNELPEDHKAQCHAEMWVTGASRCWFVAYASHASIDNMMVEVKRDAFTEQLGTCIARFCDRLEKLQREILESEYECVIMSPKDRINLWTGKEAA